MLVFVPLEYFHLLFVKFVFSSDSSVIRSHTGVGSAAWGVCMGPFFFSYFVLLGPRPHPQLSSAKETNTADTAKLPRKYLCGGQLQVWVHTR